MQAFHLNRHGRTATFVLLVIALLSGCQTSPLELDTIDTEESLAIVVASASTAGQDLDGQTVSGTVTLAVPHASWIREVRFHVDGQRVHTTHTVPYEYQLDSTTLADGEHTVAIQALNAGNRVRVQRSVTFTVANESSGEEQQHGETVDPETSDPEADDPSSSDPEAGDPETVPSAPDDERAMTLRGDPSFDVSGLSADERVHFERMWEEILDPDNQRELQALIDGADLYYYSRTIQDYIQPILTAFRATGDLRLLDHVDSILERMSHNLTYGWDDGSYSDYRMWIHRYDAAGYGTDVRLNDLKVHALVAMVAYALDMNRDLTSPGGRDYAASADYWKAYLLTDSDGFVAKVKDGGRFPSPSRGFHFTNPHADAHSWWSTTKLYYYMWRLSGDAVWLEDANRAADVIWDYEIRDIADWDGGNSAYVWASNMMSQSSSRNYLQMVGYAGSIYGDVVTFHYEGFHKWGDPAHLPAFARSIAELQLDSDDIVRNGLAGDIGGNSPYNKRTVAGIEPDDRDNRPLRRTAEAFTRYQTPIMAAWDPSGAIARAATDAQTAYPAHDTTRLAAALFLHAHVQPDAAF